MRRQTIVGLIAALLTGTVVVAATAAEGDNNRAPFWPKLKGDPVVTEWYSDIPWRQKLGTFQGNKIDVAIVLPYDVLRPDAKTACANPEEDPVTHVKLPPLTEEQCMIEIGVTNVVGTYRTDTPYDPDDAKSKGGTYCKDSGDPKDTKLPCIEVKLELSNWWAQPPGKTLPANTNTLNQQDFGNEVAPDYLNGFVFTEASVYAPQMPWYMSHYCDSRWNGDSQDPVCYGDYLSPMNAAFNPNAPPGVPAREWPAGKAFSVYPSAPPPAPGNHCKAGLKTCTIVLAGFDLTPVPSNPLDLQYQPWNDYLNRWFNRALASFPDQVTPAEKERHFAWITKAVGWEDFVYPQALFNPFQGAFTPTERQAKCEISFDGNNGCANTGDQFAEHFRYPGQCSLSDLAGAAGADLTSAARLRNCSLAYEIHANGFKWQWSDPAGVGKDYGSAFEAANMKGNGYGRTIFLLAGVPGLQLPVSFLKDTKSDSGLSIYEQVYNASIFSMYLPVANVADFKNAVQKRDYLPTEFYHTLLMSNHNESDPWQFADGIRGKVLWHNEYRMQGMYAAKSNSVFRDRTFAASFNPATAKVPFHNETCDGCHVRNGSGIPINTEGKLDKLLQEYMTSAVYNPSNDGPNKDGRDYTFTGQIRPMKLVFFDLRRDTRSLDASRYSEPLSLPWAVLTQPGAKSPKDDLYYNNKIMNYYGDSFHVTKPGYNYTWTYEKVNPNRMVVKDKRQTKDLKAAYDPQQIQLSNFATSSSCDPNNDFVSPAPTTKPWPSSCKDIDGAAITAAVAAGGGVGFMHLNGKRLGNLGAMEAIPAQAIIGFRDSQKAVLGNKIAGELIWQAGSRDGIDGTVRKCEDGKPKDLTQCFIGRFGWVGDRVSLEDQVANAAFVEMNMTTSAGYTKLYPKNDAKFPIRYAQPNCGPANKPCVNSKGNADLTERDVERMADYARWLGSPTRSEFQVALPEVIAGEKIFRETGCATCHVIRKIEIDPDDTMLTKDFRDRLKTRVQAAKGTAPAAAPFLSYIGTDLLMHDMGYLSQVADASEPIRDDKTGVVKRQFENYVQKIRTPALKGLGINRFVTDSYRNTKTYKDDATPYTLDAACDFLLHDGRACDAIEAAFLHDGPAIKELGVITKLKDLSTEKVEQLRAFLYSL